MGEDAADVFNLISPVTERESFLNGVQQDFYLKIMMILLCTKALPQKTDLRFPTIFGVVYWRRHKW